jgi:transformation/transcription domain-associated protein
VTILADSNAKDEIKVKAAQELSENFEASREGFRLRVILKIVADLSSLLMLNVTLHCVYLQVIIKSPQYPTFLDHFMKIFLKILQEGEPHFIAEYNIQVSAAVYAWIPMQ